MKGHTVIEWSKHKRVKCAVCPTLFQPTSTKKVTCSQRCRLAHVTQKFNGRNWNTVRSSPPNN